MPTVNIRAFSHKKSTVVENGGPKLPTAAQLELGEIAINFAKGYETLSIKNNNDEIVTFTNDNYWINKEQAIAAALNDLNDRKQDALEMDETPTEGSQNVVTSGGLYSYITEIEHVTAAALNDLNDRISSLGLSDDYAAASQGTPPLAGDTYETAISKLHKVIVDDELITSSALNDLNSRIDNLSLSEDYEAVDPTSEPAGGDTYEEAISKLHGAILENELATSGALNDLNTRISDIVIPELILSEDYEPSSLSNEDLFLAPGDSYETAFAKLEKTINDNENITSAALTDLDSRLNLLHLPQSLDDIPDGSTRKLSDYATTTQLATKQDTLVSGTNIKTINNQSLLGSGNITIQGGSGGGDTNVIETVKVNGTALTPDSNKAVDIKAGNGTISNTLNLGTFVSDTYINQNNGQEVTYTGWSSTDYIALDDDVIQIKSSKSLPYSALYDSNKNFLSVIKLNNTFINIEDAKYIRISGSNSDMNSVVVTTKSTSNVDIWIPANTSDLNNDSGFITEAPVTSVNDQTGAVTLTLGDTNVIEEIQINESNYPVSVANKIANIDPSKITNVFNGGVLGIDIGTYYPLVNYGLGFINNEAFNIFKKRGTSAILYSNFTPSQKRPLIWHYLRSSNNIYADTNSGTVEYWTITDDPDDLSGNALTFISISINLSNGNIDILKRIPFSSIATDISTLQSNVSTIQGDLSDAETNISTLQTNVSTISGKMDTWVPIEWSKGSQQGHLNNVGNQIDALSW